MPRRTAAQLIDQGAAAERAAVVAYLFGRLRTIAALVADGKLPEDEARPLKRRLRAITDEIDQGLHL